jgi:hypothetical protein
MKTKEINLENVVSEFLRQFPEYPKHPDIINDDYSDTPYSFFGVINSDLIRNIEENKNTNNVSVVISWINNLYNDPNLNKNLRNMFYIEFFETTIGAEKYKDYLLKNLTGLMHLELRQYIYIVENGGLTDPTTGEILKYTGMNTKSIRTGKFISDIK